MTEWNWAIAFNNGFGFYFGMVETQTAVGVTEDGEHVRFDIGGFELLLPFLVIQLLESRYEDEDDFYA
jgi:hypothetical protein